MKMKIFYAAGALLLLSACGGKSGESADSTTAGESDDAAIEEMPQEKVTDLVCLDAHGDIERLVETVKENLYESNTTFLFDEEGHLVAINGEKVGMERDDNGMPVRLTINTSDDMGEPQQTYISFLYDDNNRLMTEKHEEYDASWNVIYTRDDSGRQTGMEINDGVGNRESYTFSYPENSTDEQGNWTTRTQTSNGVATTITRSITYRQR